MTSSPSSSLSYSSSSSQNTSFTVSINSSFSSLFSFTQSPTHINQSFSIKLTTKNYIAWKLQFTPLLNFYNLHEILDGTESCPPKEKLNSETQQLESNPEYKQWFTKDQLLFSWLLDSIFEEIYLYLLGPGSSSAVWSALTTAFGTVSHA